MRKTTISTIGMGLGVGLGVGLFGLPSGPASAAPPRPDGYSQIVATFGPPCNAYSYYHTSSWAHGAWDGSGNPVTMYSHAGIADLTDLARYAIAATSGGDNKLTFGIGSYDCRAKRNNPNEWSPHAWGIAVDTNTAPNPDGQTYWNGYGWNWIDYGTAVPAIWKSNQPGWAVNFVWGLGWNDPHHFQYCTGY